MEPIFISSGNSEISAVYRLGSPYVNWYLVDSVEGILVIDTGLPSHWYQLLQAVKHLGKTVTDITHVLLTHAHPDHMGTAERIRRESNALVLIHEMDAMMVKAYQPGPPPTGFLKQLWRPAVLKMFISFMRDQAMNAPSVMYARSFSDGERLPIPGAPLITHVPGHTKGSCAFYFENEQLLFSGDALITFILFRAKKSPPPRFLQVRMKMKFGSL